MKTKLRQKCKFANWPVADQPDNSSMFAGLFSKRTLGKNTLKMFLFRRQVVPRVRGSKVGGVGIRRQYPVNKI